MTGVVDRSALVPRAFAAAQLSHAQLEGKLQAQGYTNVQVLRHEGNRALVSAKDGKVVQLALNGSTGQVAGDDDDDGD